MIYVLLTLELLSQHNDAIRFLPSFVFLSTRSFFTNRLRELVPPLVASIIMAKFEQIQ